MRKKSVVCFVFYIYILMDKIYIDLYRQNIYVAVNVMFLQI